MNILDKIVEHKKKEVERSKKQTLLSDLGSNPLFCRKTISMREAIQKNGAGVIAEIKRKSPSKGVFKEIISAGKLAEEYAAAGAAALSILTDFEFFGGSPDDLKAARFLPCPILRKDFIIDLFQIEEARSMGADAILLIAAILDEYQIRDLTQAAHALDLEVLLEIHSPQELKKCEYNPDLVGVNNRDLKTFKVNIDISKNLFSELPPDAVKVSESGILSAQTAIDLYRLGYQGFLVGQNFMSHPDPAEAAFDFIHEFNEKR